MDEGIPTGDDLVALLAALASPHRLRVVAALAGGRNYVSQLARERAIRRARFGRARGAGCRRLGGRDGWRAVYRACGRRLGSARLRVRRARDKRNGARK